MTALPVPEEQGGFNGSAVDMFVVMQELGRGLVVEPYFATVLGAEFLRLGGGHGALLEQVASGELKLACALGERQSRHDMFDIATTRRRERATAGPERRQEASSPWRQAGSLLVSARSGGAQRGQDGISLFVLPADAPASPSPTTAPWTASAPPTSASTNVQAPRAQPAGRSGARAATSSTPRLDYGAGLLCAEALGAMEAIFAATLEYLKTRQQFGAPIGKFQALQHRMADMYIHLEQARSMALLAAVKLARAMPGERRRAVSAAKYRVNQAARFVGQQAVQLHGGMGVTDELPAAHYFKRLTMIELTLGDSDHHLARFIAQPGFAKGSAA
jgi:alkylation response protein AidB-like acyl-CoA dehydrogenase